jgi:hypothetical protein
MSHKPAFIVVSSEPVTEQEFAVESNKITQLSDGIVQRINQKDAAEAAEAED